MASVFLAVGLLSSGQKPGEWTQLIMIAVVLAQLVIPLGWYIFFCVRFVDPWTPIAANLDEVVEPLRSEEFQVVKESL